MTGELARQQRLLDVELGGPACVVCGCTENAACANGCSWKQLDPFAVCSSCCGLVPAAAFARGWQPCPLEHGHAGDEHFIWTQTVEPGETRRKNGVRIAAWNPAAKRAHVICMADFRGAVDAGEVASLVTFGRPM